MFQNGSGFNRWDFWNKLKKISALQKLSIPCRKKTAPNHCHETETKVKRRQRRKENNAVRQGCLLPRCRTKTTLVHWRRAFWHLSCKNITMSQPKAKDSSKEKNVLFDVEFHAQGEEVSTTDQFPHSEFNLFDQQHQYSGSGINFHSWRWHIKLFNCWYETVYWKIVYTTYMLLIDKLIWETIILFK